MKGGSLPAATFRGAYHHHSDKERAQERTQEPDDADKQHSHRHNHHQQWVPVYSLVMTALVMGLVVPISEHAHPVAGATLALILALVSVILVYRFVAGVRTSTMTDWEYVRMPGALACLDIYLFVCLNWAMIWFVIWATDKDGALSPTAAAGYSDSTAAHLVYLVILYNVLASFWFSGGGRLYPASPLAYTWGFLSLVIGAWLAILVAGWLVHIVRRSPSRVNENTLLPVYHTPYPAPSASAFSGMGSTMTGATVATATPTAMTVSTTSTRNATPTPTLQEQEELRKTMMRLAQAQKEQRLLQQRAAEAANKAKNPAPSVSPIPLLQQQQQQPQQQQRGGIGEKSTKAKDI